jgi:hypothetical protein
VTLSIVGGFGAGAYPAGAVVHVWADVPPEARVMSGWTAAVPADTALLAEPDEWHTTITMPDHDVTITATAIAAPAAPTLRTYTGATARPKSAYVFAPAAAPRGLLLVLHGTGGAAAFGVGGEAGAVARRAVARGWWVVSPEAEEAVAGDLDGDGKARWNVAIAADNADLASLDALVVSLRAEAGLPDTAPNAVIGMSNGGGMAVALGAVSALAGASLPALRFAGVVAHCSSGRDGQVAATTTPTAFLACGNDDNDQVDNARTQENRDTLAARGVRTVYRAHPASPLFAQRFTRVVGVDAATSQAIYGDLTRLLDAGGLFTVTSDALLAEVMAHPEKFPSLSALAARQRNGVLDQVRATMAAHQMYSDWAAYELAFLDGAAR